MCRNRGGGGLGIEYYKLPVGARYISLNSSKVAVSRFAQGFDKI